MFLLLEFKEFLFRLLQNIVVVCGMDFAEEGGAKYSHWPHRVLLCP